MYYVIFLTFFIKFFMKLKEYNLFVILEKWHINCVDISFVYAHKLDINRLHVFYLSLSRNNSINYEIWKYILGYNSKYFEG